MKTSEDPGNAAVEVLIVEDSPTQALQLTHMLERHGYRTAIANNSREALTRLHQGSVSLMSGASSTAIAGGYGQKAQWDRAPAFISRYPIGRRATHE
jgi:CheY-like chemotaxis protein